MAHYTMVKTTNFNGVRLPDIDLYDPAAGKLSVVRHFEYDSYRNRLS
jgi:carboxynorspermidine decarboxylase